MTEITNLSSDVTELTLSYLPIPTSSALPPSASSGNPSSPQQPSPPRNPNPGSSSTASTTPPPKTTSPSPLTLSPTAGSVSPPPPSLPTITPTPASSAPTASSSSPPPTSPTPEFLKRSWCPTSPLHFSRINPLLGVFGSSSSSSASLLPNFIVVGGVRFIGNLVDIEDRLAVEIYNPENDTWQLGPPLPADFRSGNSSQSLSSALLNGRFYVFGIYSCFISSFDLHTNLWSQVRTLRPPGVVFSFLIGCRDRLVLAGICNGPLRSSFNLWRIEEDTMEFSEIAIMPQDLLCSLFEGDEEDKFASLKCVGLGNLIYVFNEEYHKKYPACVCEISSETGKCSWRRVPQLPSPVNKFHQVISFCSTVSLNSILQAEEEGDVGPVQPMVD